MLQERFNHLAVNWVDGMSINKEHFIAQENYMRELSIDAIGQQLHAYNYGILPNYASDILSIQMDIDSRQVLHARVENLRAVTLCGARIEITPYTLPELELSVRLGELVQDEPEERYFALVLTVNPYARTPFGNADPEENPPRKPNVLPQYNLNLVPLKGMGQAEPGLYHLTLGMLRLQNGEFSVIEDYIPPCTSMQSHMLLLGFMGRTEKSLMLLEQYATKIVQKVRSKQQINNLAVSLSSLAQNILSYLSTELPAFRLYLKNQPPVFTLEKVIALARVTHNSIQTWQGNGKEELLNYLTEWCDLNQGMFDKTLAQLAELSYQHHNSAQAISRAESFLRVLVPLFSVLSELDYIGKKVDSNLFVTEVAAENLEEEKKPVLKGWFKR